MKEEKDTKVVQCMWYSEIQSQLLSYKKKVENIFKQSIVNAIVFEYQLMYSTVRISN